MINADGYELPQSCTISTAAAQLVTREELKRHVNLDAAETHEDDYLDVLLKVVTKAVENAVNHAVIKRQADFHFTGRTGKFKIAEQAIINFKTLDVSDTGGDTINDIFTGAGQNNTEYIARGIQSGTANEPAAVATLEEYPNLTRWRDAAAESEFVVPVTITCDIGYETIPDDLKQAALQCGCDLFDHRGEIQNGSAGKVIRGYMGGDLVRHYRRSNSGALL